MKKSIPKGIKQPMRGLSVNIAIMVTFLLCGIVFGCAAASYVDTDSGQFLEDYVGKYAELAQNGVGEYSFIKTLFNLAKYPVLIFLLGFTALGVFCVPAVMLVKGFFMSLSAASVIHTFGGKGILLALSMFGIQTFISIPCLLILSAVSYEFSKSFLSVIKRDRRFGVGNAFGIRSYVTIGAICLLALALCAVFDVLITPELVNRSSFIAK